MIRDELSRRGLLRLLTFDRDKNDEWMKRLDEKGFPPTQRRSTNNLPFEHWGVLEHFGQHNKENFTAPQIDLRRLALDAVWVRHNGVLDI